MASTELKTLGTPIIDTMVLTTVLGQQIDITLQFRQFIIYEDIFSPVLTGELLLEDNLGMFDHFPISGNEKLSILFYSYGYGDPDPLNYINRTFDVLKVENVELKNDMTKIYTLIFASPELKKNETIKISKGYENMTISAMVANIMTADYDSTTEEPLGLGFPTEVQIAPQVLSKILTPNDIEVAYQKVDKQDSVELFIEKARYNDTIGVPYQKPFEIINWLSTRAIRNSGGFYNQPNGNFLFFENKRGFQFVTFDTLIEQKASVLPIFKSGLATVNLPILDGAGNPTQDRTVDFYRVETLKIEDCYDIIQNIRSGLYSSRYQTYDITTGETNQIDFDYMKAFATTETVDGGLNPNVCTAPVYPLISQDAAGLNPLTTKPLSKRIFTILGNRGYDPISTEETNRYSSNVPYVGPEQYLQNRIAQLARFGQFRVSIDISGNTRHKVGDMIDLDIDMWIQDDSQKQPSTTGPLFTQRGNKYYSGCYLITAIKHVVTYQNYTMSLELVKDSVTAQIGPVPDTTTP